MNVSQIIVIFLNVLFMKCIHCRYAENRNPYRKLKENSGTVNDLLSFTELNRIQKKTKSRSEVSDEEDGATYITNQSIKRSESGHTENLCQPRDVMVSTYTFERGSQHPRTVKVKRCQGGIKNPENYQCQPSMVQIQCFATTNDWRETDFIGTFIHTQCEERCVCNRKSCSGRKLYDLQCPVGYVENKSKCQCESVGGVLIFYRNMGMLTHWNKDLHKLCKKHGAHMKIHGGQSFSINN